MSVSIFVIGLAVFVGFLGLLMAMALGATKVVSSDGKTSRGALGGCGAAIVLVVLCLMGMFGLGAFVLFMGYGAVVEMNPIESIEVERVAPDPLADNQVPDLRLTFEVRGDAGQELFELVRNHVSHKDIEWPEATPLRNELGEEITQYTFLIPDGDRELYELEAQIEHELDGLRVNLPRDVRIEFKGIGAR